MEHFIEQAEIFLDTKDFASALKCYNYVVRFSSPHPYLYGRIAFCYRMLNEMERAIEYFTKALDLDPGDCKLHWSRGACFNDKAFLRGMSIDGRAYNLEKALFDYRSALKLDPTSQETWLAILEIDLWLMNFDDAISHYAECKPFIISKEFRLIRSWYGCLALVLAGETVKEEDCEFLYNEAIRLKWYDWAVFAVDLYLDELEKDNYSPNRLRKALEIHKILMSHFDDEPFDPNKT